MIILLICNKEQSFFFLFIVVSFLIVSFPESFGSNTVVTKPKRRAPLLKRKALTTGFFDNKGKDDKEKGKWSTLKPLYLFLTSISIYKSLTLIPFTYIKLLNWSLKRILYLNDLIIIIIFWYRFIYFWKFLKILKLIERENERFLIFQSIKIHFCLADRGQLFSMFQKDDTKYHFAKIFAFRNHNVSLK